MKKTTIHIIKLTLILLSFFIVYINLTSTSLNQNIQQEPLGNAKHYVIFEKFDWSCINFQKEQLTNILTNIYTLNFKKHLNDFSFQKLSIFELNENIISQYIQSTKKSKYRFEYIVLLFPYHYFW